MKFQFGPDQSQYLTVLLRLVLEHSRREDIESGLFKTASKMKYKFNQSGSLVSLGQKERKLITEMLAYRHTELMKQNSISPEVELIENIITKIKL